MGRLGKNLPGAWDLARGPEFESFQGRLDGVLVAVVDNTLAAVVERGGDVLVRVDRLVRLDNDRVIRTRGSGVNNRFRLGLGRVEPRGDKGFGGGHGIRCKNGGEVIGGGGGRKLIS